MRTNVDNVSRPRSEYTLVGMRTLGRKLSYHNDGHNQGFLYTMFHLFWNDRKALYSNIHELHFISCQVSFYRVI